MTRDERLRILGPAMVAEIHRHVAELPPPPAELVAELRRIFAPAVADFYAERAHPHQGARTAA